MDHLAENKVIIESVEGESGTLMLQRRATPDGERFELIVGGHFVMSAVDGKTERMLATRTLADVDSPGPLSVCVGGLGLGLTLSQALRDDRVDDVVVAEIEEAVVRWNRVYLSRFNGGALTDCRVSVHIGDVMELIRRGRRRFDALLLDVDNGPSFLVLEQNVGIYTLRGLKAMRRALAPGGVLGLWSHRPDEKLHRLLDDVFDTVDVTLIEDNHHDRDLPLTAIYTAKKYPKSRRAFLFHV